MLHAPPALPMYWAIWSEPWKAWVLQAKPGELSSWMMRTLVGSWFFAAQGPKMSGATWATKS